MVAESLRDTVRRRAQFRCEYCLMPEEFDDLPHQMDHVFAKKHVTDNSIENLALACVRCNQFKGPNIAGIDPATRTVERLFNPRTDRWTDHFAVDRAFIVPKTPIARVTIHVLHLNDDFAVNIRLFLIARSLYTIPG